MVHRSVIRATARHFGVFPAQITGPYKGHPMPDARRVASYILNRRRDCSLHLVGTYMRRDHTTVIHNVQRMDELIEADERWVSIIDKIDREAASRKVRPSSYKSEQVSIIRNAACANFGHTEKHMERGWYHKQNQAYIEAVLREHGEEGRW